MNPGSTRGVGQFQSGREQGSGRAWVLIASGKAKGEEVREVEAFTDRSAAFAAKQPMLRGASRSAATLTERAHGAASDIQALLRRIASSNYS
eukprot:8591107-Pyramimonas_sp.AAC.1